MVTVANYHMARECKKAIIEGKYSTVNDWCDAMLCRVKADYAKSELPKIFGEELKDLILECPTSASEPLQSVFGSGLISITINVPNDAYARNSSV